MIKSKKTITASAIAGAILAAVGVWTITHPAPISFGMNETKDELVIHCVNARPEDAQDIGIVPVHEGEMLYVENYMGHGSIDLVFTSDTKRITAHLGPTCETEYGVTTLDGDWKVRVAPTESDANGTVTVYKMSIADLIEDPVKNATLHYVEQDGAEVISDSPVSRG